MFFEENEAKYLKNNGFASFYFITLNQFGICRPPLFKEGNRE